MVAFFIHLNILDMIKELVEDFAKSDFHKQTIVPAIEKHIGRKLTGKETVRAYWHIFYDDKNGYEIRYGVVYFQDDIYGFLEVDYSEPCVKFIPSSLLLPI